MAELYMARTCKHGVLRVMGGDVWNHSGDVLITPANNRLSGREGLDAMIHQKAGKELTQVTRNICLDMRKINAPPCAVTKNVVTEPFALETNYKQIIHVVGLTAVAQTKTNLAVNSLQRPTPTSSPPSKRWATLLRWSRRRSQWACSPTPTARALA